MGRTVPSYRIILEREIAKWRGFFEALRRDDRAVFEELMNHCRCHASAAGAATRPIVAEAMFMSILLSHEKALKKIQTTLDSIKSKRDSIGNEGL